MDLLGVQPDCGNEGVVQEQRERAKAHQAQRDEGDTSPPGSHLPELGEHTEEVLLEAGFTWDEITALSAEGAI